MLVHGQVVQMCFGNLELSCKILKPPSFPRRENELTVSQPRNNCRPRSGCLSELLREAPSFVTLIIIIIVLLPHLMYRLQGISSMHHIDNRRTAVSSATIITDEKSLDACSACSSIRVSDTFCRNSSRFQSSFERLGCGPTLSEEVFNMLEEFTCRLYAACLLTTDVNDLRYHLFRSKQGKIESAQLLPCLMHAKRANYLALICKKCLQNSDIPKPHDGHGWNLAGDGTLDGWFSSSRSSDGTSVIFHSKTV